MLRSLAVSIDEKGKKMQSLAGSRLKKAERPEWICGPCFPLHMKSGRRKFQAGRHLEILHWNVEMEVLTK